MPLVLTTVNTEAQYATNVPGTTTLLEGPAAGSDNVVLTVSLEGNPWMASASTAWLHLSAANQKGSGITNVVFSFDANPGITRVSTLTIAGQTLTVTQAAPAMYQRPRCPLDYLFPDCIPPGGVAVDGAGNLYIADTYNNAIKELPAGSSTVAPLVGSGSSDPAGVAVDRSGNVYISDTGNNAVREWLVASNSAITLVASGLSSPRGISLDRPVPGLAGRITSHGWVSGRLTLQDCTTCRWRLYLPPSS